MSDESAFASRVAIFQEAATAFARSVYDADGHWIASSPVCARESFWLAGALYARQAREHANAIILAADTDRSSQKYPGSHFDIFHTNIAAFLLARFGDSMAPSVCRKLEVLVREGFGMYPGNRAPEFQFHGYNDNMPAKAAMGLILGGELLECPEAVAHGRWSLQQLASQLGRRGINSEFNSPTYTPLTIHALAEIATHAIDRECRELALSLEGRLWIDLASRFHPGIGLTSGPYSRAYAVDALGHVSVLASLLWFVLGDAARPSPMEIFASGSDLVFHHTGDRAFNVAQMCWIAGGAYHVPTEARQLFSGKSFPFRSVATAEMGHSSPDFPARTAGLVSHLEKDFSVGAMSTPFLSGEQSAPYFVTYKRMEEVLSIRDTGTIFSKFVINGNIPGTVVSGPTPSGPSGESDLLPAQGNSLAFPSGTTVCILSHPHLSLGGSTDEAPANLNEISALDECVIFPAHFGGADEICVGNTPRSSWDGSVARGDWIACRRGRLFVAIRPLGFSRDPEGPRISLERAHCYEIIRISHFAGTPRHFSRDELRLVFSGFVAEHASVDEFSSLEEFAASQRQSRITDYYWTTRRFRYRKPGLDLEVSVNPGAHEPRFFTVNGRTESWPRLEIDGLDLQASADPLPASPTYFPWKKLELIGLRGEGIIGEIER